MISTPNSARLSIQMRAGYYVESKMYIFARKVGNGPSRDLYLGRWIQSVSRICSDLFICLRLMMMSLWFFVSELALERERARASVLDWARTTTTLLLSLNNWYICSIYKKQVSIRLAKWVRRDRSVGTFGLVYYMTWKLIGTPRWRPS